jgi:hypothetical protein
MGVGPIACRDAVIESYVSMRGATRRTLQSWTTTRWGRRTSPARSARRSVKLSGNEAESDSLDASSFGNVLRVVHGSRRSASGRAKIYAPSCATFEGPFGVKATTMIARGGRPLVTVGALAAAHRGSSRHRARASRRRASAFSARADRARFARAVTNARPRRTAPRVNTPCPTTTASGGRSPVTRALARWHWWSPVL